MELRSLRSKGVGKDTSELAQPVGDERIEGKDMAYRLRSHQ